jgi:hypothetical protein
MKRTLVPAALVAVSLAAAAPAAAQQPAAQSSAAPAAAADQQKLVELLRKDVRAAKADIVAKTMEMDSTTAAAFWPIYKLYEAESVKLGDEQMAIVHDYAKAWNSKALTDAAAKDLMTRAVALEDKKAALNKKYIDEMLKVLPAKTVARFYQVNSRVNALITLSLSSEIPLIY